jgi:cholesterol transport system auxiliary component
MRGRLALASLATACALLGGCSLLGGGGQKPTTLYAPDPRIAPDPSWPKVHWQLSVGQPSAARVIDSLRIAVRPTPDEIQVYKGAAWAKLPSDMLVDTVTRALEDSGDIGGIARQGTGVSADYKLVMDMRRFEADYAGGTIPAATIEVNAKLLNVSDQSIVASRTFLHAEPAAGTDVAQVVDAFSRSLESVGRDMVGWTLSSGDGYERGDMHAMRKKNAP